MTEASDATPLDRLFLGRQPILDANQALVGYELLFRDSAINRAPAAPPGMATADVVCKAYAELGLANALEGHKAFIIVDATFLHNEAIEELPAENVVFELDATLAADPAVTSRCEALGQRGYAFCLTGLGSLSECVLLLLKQAMFMKLDIQTLPDETMHMLLALPSDFRPLSIASHVETPADYQRAVALGFELFQGYYFAEPTLVAGKRLDPATQGLIRIISLLNRDAELPEIERAFKSEPALTVKLLRLTNSAGVGLRVRIASVRQAVTLIGRRHIQRWLQLLLYSQHSGADVIERNPLMQLAALKGNFMERLAHRSHPQQSALPDLAFLAGMMSLMPAALGMPMSEILDQIGVVQEIRDALLTHGGDLGLLLELTNCYDNDDPDGADRIILQLGGAISLEILNQCLTESIAWVQALTKETG